MKYKFAKSTLFRDRNGTAIIFNLENDERLLELTGDYSELLQFLDQGSTSLEISERLKIPLPSLQIFLDEVTKIGLFEDLPSSPYSNEVNVYAMNTMVAKVINFNDYLPQTDPSTVYASYCACNCCTACDSSSCCT